MYSIVIPPMYFSYSWFSMRRPTPFTKANVFRLSQGRSHSAEPIQEENESYIINMIPNEIKRKSNYCCSRCISMLSNILVLVCFCLNSTRRESKDCLGRHSVSDILRLQEQPQGYNWRVIYPSSRNILATTSPAQKRSSKWFVFEGLSLSVSSVS